MRGWTAVIGTATVIVMSVVLAVTLHAAQAQDTEGESRRKAGELWELAIAAKGGRERLRRVERIFVSLRGTPGMFWVRANHSRLDALYVFPSKFRLWTSQNTKKGNRVVTVFDAEKGRAMTVPTSHRDHCPCSWPGHEGEGTMLVGQLLYLMESRWMKPVPVRVSEAQVGLKTVDVVYTTANDYRAIYYLDRKTHLPIRVATLSPNCDENNRELLKYYTVDFSDYAMVDGIALPKRIGFRPFLFSVRYELNPPFDASAFDLPPTVLDEPEAWRVEPTPTQ